MRRLLAVLLVLAVGAGPAAASVASAGKPGPLAAKQAKAKAKKKAAAKRRAQARKRALAKRREAARLQAQAEQQAAAPVVPAPEAPAGPAVTTPAADSDPAAETPPVAALAWTVSIAVDEFTLTPTRSLLGSGLVTIELRNVGEDPHDLRVDTLAGAQVALWAELAPGEFGRPATDVKQVALTPGGYRFYCTLPGHAALGMDKQLTVAAG